MKVESTEGSDITVTTATRSEAEVRASLGAEPKIDEKPAAAAAPAAGADGADDDGDPAAGRPDADASEAGRVLRSNRLKERKTRLTDEVSTYEESIKLLGGTPPALEKREYKTPQDELDHLTKRRFELAKLNTQLLKGRRSAPAPAAPARPASAPAGDKGPELPKFEFEAGKQFPTWEDWQEKNPDRDYTAYISEFNNKRDDARDTWRDQVADIKRQHAEGAARQVANQDAEAAAVASIDTATQTFRTDYADYDEVTGQVSLDHLGANRLRAFRVAMLYEGERAPQILYFLGKNPDEVARLQGAQNPAQLYSLMGEFRVSAKAYVTSLKAAPPAGGQPAAGAPAAAAAPSKPKPGAPAPLAAVPGGATHSRTPAQIAEDDEDADSYIDARLAQTKPRRRSG